MKGNKNIYDLSFVWKLGTTKRIWLIFKNRQLKNIPHLEVHTGGYLQHQYDFQTTQMEAWGTPKSSIIPHLPGEGC